MQRSDFTESADLSLTNNGLRERIVQRLTHIWRQYHVETLFQDIFVESLNEASVSQWAEMAKEEGELTANGQSFAFSLQMILQRRGEVFKRTEEAVGNLQRKDNKCQRDIDHICTLLTELRETNLQAAELMLDINRYFSEALRQNCFSPTLAKQIQKLDEDNAFMRRSILRKFILFSKTYDPFLLKHQEALRTTHNPRLREISSIQRLFSLPISHVYRLEKTQKECLDYIAKGTPILTGMAKSREKSKKFRIISPVRQSTKGKRYKYFSSPKERALDELQRTSAKLDDELNSFRLDKDIYFANRIRLNSQSQDFQKVRKGSGDQMTTTPSYSTRVRNFSVKSTKDSQLPKLKTLQSQSFRDSISLKTKDTTTLTKRYNAYQSINQMEEREKQLKSFVLPKKFDKLDGKYIRETCPDAVLRESSTKQSPPAGKSIQASIQCDTYKMTLPSRTSPSHREPSLLTTTAGRQEKSPSSSPPPVQPPSPNSYRQGSTIENRRIKYKKYQLKAAKISIDKFMDSFRALPFNPNYSHILSVGSWENSIRHNQYYYHKFFVNQEMAAVALSCALPEGDILIKCWAPLASCDREMSQFLFGKYVEHIEKSTLCNTIFYNNLHIEELSPLKFQRKKERIYQRQRIYATLCQKGDYSPFLSLHFSSVAVNKDTPAQEGLLAKSQIQQFNPWKFLCFNYLLIINKLMSAGSFSSVATYHPRLPSIRQCTNPLLSQSLSPQPYSLNFKCAYCHLLTLKLKNPIKYAFFLADKGYIKLFGQIVLQTEDTIIVVLPFLRYNVRMFFARGVRNAEQMVTRCRQPAKQKAEKVNFSVRMFKKRLRGRMQGINLKEENTYGDFQLTFSWRDFLKGNIQHPIKESDEIFDTNFYCLIEMQRQLLFVFEVTPTDFIQ